MKKQVHSIVVGLPGSGFGGHPKGESMAVKVLSTALVVSAVLAFRQMFGHEGSEIVAINDLTSPQMLAYLLKYDSTQGNYARASHCRGRRGQHRGRRQEDHHLQGGRRQTTCLGASSASTSFSSAPVSTPPRPRLRLTSTPVPRRSSSPLLPATTCRPSSSTSTTRR